MTFTVLGTSLLLRFPGVVEPITAVGASLFLAGVAVVLLWRRLTRPAADAPENRDGDGDDSSVWNAIPSWQYEGRYVESGGLARGEQEQALQEIQQKADERSEDDARR